VLMVDRPFDIFHYAIVKLVLAYGVAIDPCSESHRITAVALPTHMIPFEKNANTIDNDIDVKESRLFAIAGVATGRVSCASVWAYVQEGPDHASMDHDPQSYANTIGALRSSLYVPAAQPKSDIETWSKCAYHYFWAERFASSIVVFVAVANPLSALLKTDAESESSSAAYVKSALSDNNMSVSAIEDPAARDTAESMARRILDTVACSSAVKVLECMGRPSTQPVFDKSEPEKVNEIANLGTHIVFVFEYSAAQSEPGSHFKRGIYDICEEVNYARVVWDSSG